LPGTRYKKEVGMITQSKRILLAIVLLIVIVAVVLGIDMLRRRAVVGNDASDGVTLAPDSIPIYVDGRLVGGFSPDDLEQLEQVSFVDAEQGKTQVGWMLSDVLDLHMDVSEFAPEAVVVVSSSSRAKSANLTWAQVSGPENRVLFTISKSRYTFKLVSSLEGLDTRDKWIQDIDKIEVSTK